MTDKEMTMLLSFALSLLVAAPMAPMAVVVASNMNPHPYKIANSDTFDTQHHHDGYAYFDVYSPLIRTLYSQVYWTMEEPVPLPTHVVEQFAGDRVMAVVGYEVDQVRFVAEDDDETTEHEVSVPITWSYNHHYLAWLMKKTPEVQRDVRLYAENHHRQRPQQHQHDSSAEPLQKPSSTTTTTTRTSTTPSYPKSTLFSEGNGGEFRSSFHSYPAGYAQLVQSPTHFQFNPMSIDTWNRTITADAAFAPGPLPQSSRIPISAGYSGLIECPCPDKFAKQWSMTYTFAGNNRPEAPEHHGPCPTVEEGPIQNATECLHAAQSLVPSHSYNLIIGDGDDSTGRHVPLCSLKQHTDGSVDVLWNVTHPQTLPQEGTLAQEPEDDKDSSIVAYSSALINVTVVLSQPSLPNDAGTVRIRMTGPRDRWFGMGLGASTMCLHQVSDECPDRGPYAIIVTGDKIMERKLDQHGPGRLLDPSVVVESDTVHGGNRTVVLTRPLEGTTQDYYAFDKKADRIPIIVARGCSSEFAQHCGHGASSLQFLQTNTVTPVCRAGIRGTIGGNPFSNIGRCADPPTGDLKAQKNPTCRIETYQGGMACCHHGHTLLDANQNQPWPDQYLEMRFKFRFYYEEYKPANIGRPVPSHQSLVRLYWQTETFATEYDVPQCSTATTRPDQCIHEITSRFTTRDLFTLLDETPILDGTTGVELIYAGPHCHAPSCLSMELYNADTGELLCRTEPVFGHSNKLYDERGFVAVPPCLWGSHEEGLVPPKFLSLETNLLSVKRNNSTLPHTGEMASWQMRGVIITDQNAAKGTSYNDAREDASKAISRSSVRGIGV